jgi:hypothetical protein
MPEIAAALSVTCYSLTPFHAAVLPTAVGASVSAPADLNPADSTTPASAHVTTAAAFTGKGTTGHATSSPATTAEVPVAAPWRFSNVSIHTIEHVDAPIGKLMSHHTQSTNHQHNDKV